MKTDQSISTTSERPPRRRLAAYLGAAAALALILASFAGALRHRDEKRRAASVPTSSPVESVRAVTAPTPVRTPLAVAAAAVRPQAEPAALPAATPDLKELAAHMHDSPEAHAAFLSELQKRTPAGALPMIGGLDAPPDEFDPDPKRVPVEREGRFLELYRAWRTEPQSDKATKETAKWLRDRLESNGLQPSALTLGCTESLCRLGIGFEHMRDLHALQQIQLPTDMKIEVTPPYSHPRGTVVVVYWPRAKPG